VIAVEVDFEGNAWAILRNVKKVVKIRAKPVVLGCDKTCGEGFEGTPLIQVGSWGSVSANSGRFAVNLVSGNLYLSILLIPTFDELMKNFTIYYNSLDFAFPDALGNGWTHSFLSYVKETANGVVLKLPDGKVIKFSRVGDRYLPEHFTGSSNFKYLLRTPEGWKLYKMGGEVWEFAQDGKLILIKDVKGRNWNLIYNNGLLIEVRDPVSRSLKFYYDQKGRIVKVENPAGSAWEFFYDGDFLSAVKDPLGNLANFRYNENGLLSEYIDFIGARWNIVYDDRKRATHIFDHLSRPLKIEYKDDDTVVVISRMGFRSEYVISRELVAILKLKNEIGTTLEYFYDNKGNKIKFRDSRGGEWTYEYDELGRLIKEVDPIGRVAIYEYNDLDLLTREIDTLGRERKLFYDSRGNLIREIDWAGNERKYEYNDLGLITKEINPIGAQTIYFYDRFGHISKKVDPLGNEWRYEYDILGLLLKEENPLGGKTLYFYDKLGNKIGIQDARGNVWSYEYHVKLKIKEVYPLGGVKRFWYDYAGRLTAEQNTLGYVKFFIYDADGNLVEEIDFAGNRTKFFYDFASNMTAQISALGGIEQYSRDFAGDITLTSLPTKLGSLTEYDILGRPVKVLYGKLSSFIPLVEIRNFFIAETD
jgi:YD repeat-containing protein